MISFDHAKNTFNAFAGQFDISNPKIEIKVRHTYGVKEVCDYLAKSMSLNETDYQLAMLIGLLHDIGRFEQLTRFNSYDDRLLPHAEAGLFVLFDQNHIRDYIKTDKYDSVIYHAIKNHSLYEIDPALSGQDLLHARLIRDADKLDNCRVKIEDSVDAIIDVDEVTAGQQYITDKVWESCLRREAIVSAQRETRMDYWVSYVRYFFDINFPETYEIIKQENYVERIIDRIPYSNPDTVKKMAQLKQIVLAYMEEQLSREYCSESCFLQFEKVLEIVWRR